jgi:hypothetical protein
MLVSKAVSSEVTDGRAMILRSDGESHNSKIKEAANAAKMIFGKPSIHIKWCYLELNEKGNCQRVISRRNRGKNRIVNRVSKASETDSKVRKSMI